MGNLVNTIKKFVTNKNTVTILGILAGVIVLWLFYNHQLNKAINPIKVPYAKNAIASTQQITQEDIEWIEISREFLNNVNIITNENELIGYYVNVGTSIPEGGLFYKNQVITNEELPNSFYADLGEGYTAFQLPVDNNSTIGNSIYDGDYIDVYMKATDNGETIQGKLISSIQVIAVVDSQNKKVFDSTDNRQPAYLIFGVNDELFKLLRGAKSINGVELYPVPRGKYYTENPEATEVGSQELVDYINARVRWTD